MKVRVNGERIVQLRTKLAWSQEQLADKANLSSRTVQRLERSESVALSSVQSLAKVLGVASEELLADPVRTHVSAPWSRKLQLTTFAFLAIIAVVVFLAGPYASWVVLGVLLLAGILSVRGYSVVNGQILIHRLGWSNRFDISQLERIEVEPGAIMGSIRVFGVGGLFSFIGTFRNQILGTYRAYATDADRTVVIVLNGSTIVVTPDSPDDFVNAVLAQRQD